MEGFLKGRAQISGDNVRFVASTPVGPSGAPSSPFVRAADVRRSPDGSANDGPDHKPRVEPVVEQGRVVRIRVTCSCGEVTEIDCDYSGE